MSKDRIKIFVPKARFAPEGRYHDHEQGVKAGQYRVALLGAFGVTAVELKTALTLAVIPGKYQSAPEPQEGTYLICRPSQFGRFVAFRCTVLQGENWIKEMDPTIISSEEADRLIALGSRPTKLEQVAAESVVPVSHIESILRKLEVPEKAMAKWKARQERVIDVTNRRAKDLTREGLPSAYGGESYRAGSIFKDL